VYVLSSLVLQCFNLPVFIVSLMHILTHMTRYAICDCVGINYVTECALHDYFFPFITFTIKRGQWIDAILPIVCSVILFI
jgi:hypothetical protein